MAGLDPGLVKMVLLIAGGLVLLILAVFLVRRFWKSNSRKPGKELIPSIPPYKVALKKLDRLCRKPVIDPKPFYFELSALIKRYVASSYDINAVEMTTQEFLRQIRLTGMDQGIILDVSRFLNVSDPFRYGPVAPDSSIVQKDLEAVRKLIVGMEEDLESRRTLSKQPQSENLVEETL